MLRAWVDRFLVCCGQRQLFPCGSPKSREPVCRSEKLNSRLQDDQALGTERATGKKIDMRSYTAVRPSIAKPAASDERRVRISRSSAWYILAALFGSTALFFA